MNDAEHGQDESRFNSPLLIFFGFSLGVVATLTIIASGLLSQTIRDFSEGEKEFWSALVGAGLGALLGLGVAVAAALFNAKLNRDQKRDTDAERRRAVAAAFMYELRQICGEFGNFLIAFQQDPRDEPMKARAQMVSRVTSLVYGALAHEIPRLSPEEAGSIAAFYTSLPPVCEALKLYAEGRGGGTINLVGDLVIRGDAARHALVNSAPDLAALAEPIIRVEQTVASREGANLTG